MCDDHESNTDEPNRESWDQIWPLEPTEDLHSPGPTKGPIGAVNQICSSAVRAAAARGCVLAFAGWWVALATPTQLTLFHYFCLCLGLTAEMRRVDNNVKAVIRARARKVSRGAAVD